MIFRYFIFALIIYIVNGQYQPTEYILKIAVDSEAKLYNGSVEITINIEQSIKRIDLDVHYSLQVDCESFEKLSRSENILYTCSWVWTPKVIFYIDFQSFIRPGVYVIKLTFSLKHLQRYGLLFFEYNEGDEKKIVAATQVQPNMAKYLFPCIGDPKYKAKFYITIKHKVDEYAISNVISEVDHHNIGSKPFKVTRFSFDKIAASMISFVVHSFPESIKHPYEPISIYGRKEALYNAMPMLQTIKDTLQYFKKITAEFSGIIKKLDIVLLPNDNINTEISYQLILTREQNININNVTSLDSLYYQTIGIGKMIAGQWFGIHFAPDNIEDAWIYNSMATFTAYFAINAIESNWIGFHDNILRIQELSDNNVINNTDLKGVALINMFDIFSDKNSELAEELKYGSYDHLFSAYVEWMKPWGRQNSIILLTAYVDRKYKIITNRTVFNYNRNHKIIVLEDLEVFLVNFQCELYNTSLHFLSSSSVDSWAIEQQKANVFVLCHTKLMPLIINYDVNNWQQITNVLLDYKIEHRKIFNGTVRAQIYDHAFKLARAELIDYKIPLNLSQSMKFENETGPIKILMKHLDYIETMFNFNEDLHLFKKYYISLLEPHYEQLKFDDKIAFYSHDLLKKICFLGHRSCVTNSINLVYEWMALFHANNGTKMNIEESIRPIVYCTAVRFGADSIWQFLFERYSDQKHPVPLENNNLLNALGCKDNAKLINKYLIITGQINVDQADKHNKILRKEHIVHNSIHSSSYGRRVLLNYVRDNFGEIVRTWGIHLIRNEIIKIIQKTTTNCFLMDIERLLLTNDIVNDNIISALNDAKIQVNLRNRHINEIRNWLSGAPYVNINIKPFQDPNYSFKLISTINAIKSRYSMISAPRTSFDTDSYFKMLSDDKLAPNVTAYDTYKYYEVPGEDSE